MKYGFVLYAITFVFFSVPVVVCLFFRIGKKEKDISEKTRERERNQSDDENSRENFIPTCVIVVFLVNVLFQLSLNSLIFAIKQTSNISETILSLSLSLLFVCK